MAALRSAPRKLSQFAARHACGQWLPLTGEQPVVSITFDDVLASAAHAGARVLEEHDCRGTFYIAGSLTSQTEQGRPAHTLQDMLDLHARGHDIGSHGWGHIDCARAPRKVLLADLQANLDFLRSHLGPQAGAHFAYPFGRYGLAAKRHAARMHASGRILGNGLHRQRADLNLLGCHRLYGQGRHRSQWQPLLESMRPGDWLIVNTHEVEPSCGIYGCTPADLAAFIEEARRMGHALLPVQSAIDHYQSLLRARSAA